MPSANKNDQPVRNMLYVSKIHSFMTSFEGTRGIYVYAFVFYIKMSFQRAYFVGQLFEITMQQVKLVHKLDVKFK